MSKIDNIFIKVISDPLICKEYDIDVSKYSNIAQGLKSTNVYVNSIAQLLSIIDKKVEEEKTNQRIKNISEPIVLQESFKDTTYKKILSTLQKSIL